jgi:polyhydroxyalkanoate synthesis repressor PhaR
MRRCLRQDEESYSVPINKPAVADKVAPTRKGRAVSTVPEDSRRVLKKYPNRRLYDTASSAYITLAQVKELVMRNEPFVVLEAKSGEDLTRSILLQIILEEETGGAPLFSETALANLIRFYGHTMQGFIGAFLEKNMQSFTDVQAKLAEQSVGLTPEMWAQFLRLQPSLVQGILGGYADQSTHAVRQLQEQMQKQTEQMLGAFGLKR